LYVFKRKEKEKRGQGPFVTRVTAASSGTYTSMVMQRAARPSAYTGAPNNGMRIPEGSLGVTDGVPGDTGAISVTLPPSCTRNG